MSKAAKSIDNVGWQSGIGAIARPALSFGRRDQCGSPA